MKTIYKPNPQKVEFMSGIRGQKLSQDPVESRIFHKTTFCTWLS
jgi:hypothetical protein